MQLNFWKMQGLGNDFMVFYADTNILTPELIRTLADRHYGIGFDQLLWVKRDSTRRADIHLRIFNADGGEVQQCGNGMRCVARFARDTGLVSEDHFQIGTDSAVYQTILESNEQVSVNMGAPIFTPNEIPFSIDKQAAVYPMVADVGSFTASVLSMGNPHCVLIVSDIANADVAGIGSCLTLHPSFPEQANIGFMQVLDRTHIELRVYERGVGETLACGSGACAAVVAGHMQGLLDESVQVHLPGGALTVRWAGDSHSVWLTGPAVKVFEAVINID